MKRRRTGLARAAVLGALAVAALPAGAEQDLGPVIVSGEAEVGGRGDWDDTDSAKYEEYREVQEGAFGSLDFLIEDTERRYYLQGWLDDIAEDDQQYRFQGGRYGRWGVRGFFSEIPHVFSNRAVTPYADTGGGILQLRPGFDRTLDPTVPADLAAYQAQLSTSPPTNRTSLKFRTIEGEGEIFFRPTPEVDLSAGYRIIDRDDSRALAFGFGSAGGNYINVAAPIDERTHEATFDAQYTRESWNFGLNYTGSFFDNDLNSFSADNPLTTPAAETPGSSAVGRYSLAPDSSSHLVSLSGAGILPTSFPAQLAATFAWGINLQDDDFLPHTSNQAIIATADPRLALPKSNLDGEVQTINANIVLTARPRSDLNVKVRYRIYDHDNDTDELTFAGEVPGDRNLRDGTTSIAYSYRKQSALAEASWRRPESLVTTTFGFTWENWRRDSDRNVRNQNDFGPTARIDWRAAKWARLRAGYAFTARLGSSYDSTGALSGLRRYPQADRLLHRFDLLAQIDPRDDLGVTLTTAFDLSDYDDSDQGLTDDNRWNIGVDISYQPHQRVGLWANYTFDYIWMFQKQGGGTWDSTTYDRAHNGGVGADVVVVPNLLDLELSYFIQRGRAKTRGGGTAVDFPTIKNTLQAVTAGVSYHALEFLTFRTIYRWEKYDVTNFHDNFGISDTQGDIWLQNRIADYDAHIVSISAVVNF